METKSEKQGVESQMMLIMDELFRFEEGASYDVIIDEYLRKKGHDSSSLSWKKKRDFLRNSATKAKCNLSKRLPKRIKIIKVGELKDPEKRNGRSRKHIFKYSDDLGNYDPLRDIRNKFKKMKLSELSELLVQSAGLFPKSWLMNFTTQINEFKDEPSTDNQINKILYFDNNDRLKNQDILPTLVDLIKRRQVIKFRYRPYDKKSYEVTVHPQLLKEYNLRWFLFALAKDKEGVLRDQQYALDRIDVKSGIISCDDIPYVRSEIDYGIYFSERVGVSGPRAESIKVEILANDMKTLEYIRTKPIHHSQKIVGNKIYYYVKLNYEFVTRLFEFADKLIVLSPEELRKKIVDRASDVLDKNKVPWHST